MLKILGLLCCLLLLAGGAAEADVAIDLSEESGVVRITMAGTYTIQGELSGQLLVDAPKKSNVTLILSGCEIACADGPALNIQQAGHVKILLADGAVNTLTDGEAYTLSEGEDEPYAALYSRDDLTIAGEGSLVVVANYRHGIVCKDDLVIEGGDIRVTAPEDGVRGRDSVTISGGALTIDAGQDGVHSNNDEDERMGTVTITGGHFDIQAGSDGIQAETVLTISGGEFAIRAGGGATGNIAVEDDRFGMPGRGGMREPPGGFGGFGQPGGFGMIGEGDASATDEISAKGVKAGTALIVEGGALEIDALDDAVHSNGDVTIKGGALMLKTDDDGVHADGALRVTGGTILITASYEGLEGATVAIEGGEIDLTAADDGINAAGGSDANAGMGGRWMDRFAASGEYYIEISGSSIRVNASGDGIDSNGDLTITGGETYISGPTNRGNGALDYQGNCRVTGGVLVASGSVGMAQTTGAGSQGTLAFRYGSVQAGGTTIRVEDPDGAIIIEYAPEKDYESVVISTPDLKQGVTYSIYADGSLLGSLEL